MLDVTFGGWHRQARNPEMERTCYFRVVSHRQLCGRCVRCVHVVLWFCLLIVVVGDLFRRHDVSGLGKVGWVILLIILPYIAFFAYLLTQGQYG